MILLKIATIVGTRPEIIRLSRVISVLDSMTKHVLIHTGQNFDHELNQIFFDEMSIRRPDHALNSLDLNPIKQISNIISQLEQLLREVKPDAVLILGDTNSCFASAYVTKRLQIPLFHMEAGNRCFDERVPEEINRRIIDHISDINLPYSSISRECLVREGIPTDRIIKTGSPLYEVLHYYRTRIDASNILERLRLKSYEYFLVSCHREENIKSKFLNFINLLNSLAYRYQQRVIVSTHPHTQKEIDSRKPLNQGVEFLKPFGFFDYVKLQMNARVTLSDSGAITEESSILNFPALNLRETHERLEGMEEGAVIFTGFNTDKVFESIPLLEKQERGSIRVLYTPNDYSTPNVSEKVVRIILSYVDYINRVVWGKH